MKFDISFLSDLMTAAFLLCFIFINFILFLIASFFQKKFDQPAPKTGFVISVIFCVIYMVLLFLNDYSQIYNKIMIHAFLLCASIASVASSLTLYVKMKRTSK